MREVKLAPGELGLALVLHGDLPFMPQGRGDGLGADYPHCLGR
jgi:hypothetical protein